MKTNINVPTSNPFQILGYNVSLNELDSKGMRIKKWQQIGQHALNQQQNVGVQPLGIRLVAELPALNEQEAMQEEAALQQQEIEEQQEVEQEDTVLQPQEIALEAEMEIEEAPHSEEQQQVLEQENVASQRQEAEIETEEAPDNEEQQIIEEEDVTLQQHEQETEQEEVAQQQQELVVETATEERVNLQRVVVFQNNTPAPVLIESPPIQPTITVIDSPRAQMMIGGQVRREEPSETPSSWNGWKTAAVVIGSIAVTAGLVVGGLALAGVFSPSRKSNLLTVSSNNDSSNNDLPSIDLSNIDPNNLDESGLTVSPMRGNVQRIYNKESNELVGTIVQYDNGVKVLSLNDPDKYFIFDKTKDLFVTVYVNSQNTSLDINLISGKSITDMDSFRVGDLFYEGGFRKVGLEKGKGLIVNSDNVKTGCYYTEGHSTYYQFDGEDCRWKLRDVVIYQDKGCKITGKELFKDSNTRKAVNYKSSPLSVPMPKTTVPYNSLRSGSLVSTIQTAVVTPVVTAPITTLPMMTTAETTRIVTFNKPTLLTAQQSQATFLALKNKPDAGMSNFSLDSRQVSRWQ